MSPWVSVQNRLPLGLIHHLSAVRPVQCSSPTLTGTPPPSPAWVWPPRERAVAQGRARLEGGPHPRYVSGFTDHTWGVVWADVMLMQVQFGLCTPFGWGGGGGGIQLERTPAQGGCGWGGSMQSRGGGGGGHVRGEGEPPPGGCIQLWVGGGRALRRARDP